MFCFLALLSFGVVLATEPLPYTHSCDTISQCPDPVNLDIDDPVSFSLSCGECVRFTVAITNPCFRYELDVSSSEVLSIEVEFPNGESSTACTHCADCTCPTDGCTDDCGCLLTPESCYSEDAGSLSMSWNDPENAPIAEVLSAVGIYSVTIRHDAYRGDLGGSGLTADVTLAANSVESFESGVVHFGSPTLLLSSDSPRKCYGFDSTHRCDTPRPVECETTVAEDCLLSQCCLDINEHCTEARVLSTLPYWSITNSLLLENASVLHDGLHFGMVVPHASLTNDGDGNGSGGSEDDPPSRRAVSTNGARLWENCANPVLSVALTEEELGPEAYMVFEIKDEYRGLNVSDGRAEWNLLSPSALFENEAVSFEGSLCPGEYIYWLVETDQIDIHHVSITATRDGSLAPEYDLYVGEASTSAFPYSPETSLWHTSDGLLEFVPAERCSGGFTVGVVPTSEMPIPYHVEVVLQEPIPLNAGDYWNNTVCEGFYVYYLFEGSTVNNGDDVIVNVFSLDGNANFCLTRDQYCTMSSAEWTCARVGDCEMKLEADGTQRDHSYYLGVYGSSAGEGVPYVRFALTVTAVPHNSDGSESSGGGDGGLDSEETTWFAVGMTLLGLILFGALFVYFRRRHWLTLTKTASESLLTAPQGNNNDNNNNMPSVVNALPPPLVKSVASPKGGSCTDLESRYRKIEGLGNKGTIEPSAVVLEERIGTGSYGEVYRGLWHGVPVAVKQLRNMKTQKQFDSLVTEVSLMSNLRHPNIVQYLGVIADASKFAIVLEYCAHGSVHDLLVANRLTDEHILCFARDAANAVNYLHSSNPVVIHRDLKAANLLVDDRLRVKVCDFGLARVQAGAGAAMTAVGTPCHAAPEVLQHGIYDKAADVYSFGVVLWELAHEGRNPYGEMNAFTVSSKVTMEGIRPPIQMNLHPEYTKLMRHCWAQAARDRPSFKEILEVLADMVARQMPVHLKMEESTWLGRMSARLSVGSRDAARDSVGVRTKGRGGRRYSGGGPAHQHV